MTPAGITSTPRKALQAIRSWILFLSSSFSSLWRPLRAPRTVSEGSEAGECREAFLDELRALEREIDRALDEVGVAHTCDGILDCRICGAGPGERDGLSIYDDPRFDVIDDRHEREIGSSIGRGEIVFRCAHPVCPGLSYPVPHPCGRAPK